MPLNVEPELLKSKMVTSYQEQARLSVKIQAFIFPRKGLCRSIDLKKIRVVCGETTRSDRF
jgi:hypothetical protein